MTYSGLQGFIAHRVSSRQQIHTSRHTLPLCTNVCRRNMKNVLTILICNYRSCTSIQRGLLSFLPCFDVLNNIRRKNHKVYHYLFFSIPYSFHTSYNQTFLQTCCSAVSVPPCSKWPWQAVTVNLVHSSLRFGGNSLTSASRLPLWWRSVQFCVYLCRLSPKAN